MTKITLNEIERLIASGESRICEDSRHLDRGDVFVAIRGVAFDSHCLVDEAISRGARAVVCEEGAYTGEKISADEVVMVPDSRKALGSLAKTQFRDPSRDLLVFGVTGTNGKSTTVSIIENILTTMGIQCGMTGTVFNKVMGDKYERSDMTTPGVLKMNSMLRQMADNGKKAAVIEISSHALHQERVHGIGLDGAVFTNITPEHMDYHGDMGSYFKAKSKILENLKPAASAAINGDDDMVRGLASKIPERSVVTFGFGRGCAVSCSRVVEGDKGSEFDLLFNSSRVGTVKSSLMGKHNVMNMMGAAAVFLKKGFPSGDIIRGMETSKPVPGRMEKIFSSAPFSVFVDYAHTPDALKNILESVKVSTTGKIFCVFGCGGNRDKEKRPVMGGIAGKICDGIILTDDNPRKEDPDLILGEIEQGIPAGSEYSIIRDRREAISAAIAKAKDGDAVIIAGKGHENYQIFKDRTLHFDDREESVTCLVRMGYKVYI